MKILMQKRLFWLEWVLILMSVACRAGGSGRLVVDETQKALPESASHVQVESAFGGPDSYTFLKAQLPEEDFLAYIETLGLTRHTPDRVYTDSSHWLTWRMGGEPDWWDPSEDLDATFVHQEGESWVFAKYENGFVYLRSFTH